MYEKLNVPEEKAIKEHLDVACKMADELMEKFQPHEQNEMIKLMYDRIKERRAMILDGAEKSFNYLKQSYEELIK